MKVLTVLVSVAKDTRNNDCLVAVKFIYPVDYKKDHQLLETTSRPSSSPAKMRNNRNNKNESDSHDLQQKSMSVNQQENLFSIPCIMRHKEIKFHKILGDHPHISKLYDHFDTCLILEFCSRGDLYEAIHSGNGPVTTPDIKDVFNKS